MLDPDKLLRMKQAPRLFFGKKEMTRIFRPSPFAWLFWNKMVRNRAAYTVDNRRIFLLGRDRKFHALFWMN